MKMKSNEESEARAAILLWKSQQWAGFVLSYRIFGAKGTGGVRQPPDAASIEN